MTKFAIFNADGLPVAFYVPLMRPVYGPTPEATEENPNPSPQVIGEEQDPAYLIPPEAIEISDEHWLEFISNQGERRWNGTKPVAYQQPAPEPEPAIILAAILYSRMTDEEYDALLASIEDAVSARTYRTFTATDRFDEGTPMYELLVQHLGLIVDAERAAELLAAA
jgi:hypothetical protein